MHRLEENRAQHGSGGIEPHDRRESDHAHRAQRDHHVDAEQNRDEQAEDSKDPDCEAAHHGPSIMAGWRADGDLAISLIVSSTN